MGMLVVSLKLYEKGVREDELTIHLPDERVIKIRYINRMSGGWAKLGIDAPRDLKINRKLFRTLEDGSGDD